MKQHYSSQMFPIIKSITFRSMHSLNRASLSKKAIVRYKKKWGSLIWIRDKFYFLSAISWTGKSIVSFSEESANHENLWSSLPVNTLYVTSLWHRKNTKKYKHRLILPYFLFKSVEYAPARNSKYSAPIFSTK